MRLAVLTLCAFMGTLFWGIVAFGVAFGVTHDPRFGEAAVVCFGGVVALLLILVAAIRWSTR